MKQKVFAVAQWVAADVLTLAPHWDTEEAEAFLDSVEDELRGAMIAAGWQALETLLEEAEEEREEVAHG